MSGQLAAYLERGSNGFNLIGARKKPDPIQQLQLAARSDSGPATFQTIRAAIGGNEGNVAEFETFGHWGTDPVMQLDQAVGRRSGLAYLKHDVFHDPQRENPQPEKPLPLVIREHPVRLDFQ
ncbi:MAG: hypothetical protein WCS42_25125 [Verrucomicrobiota bacterium]